MVLPCLRAARASQARCQCLSPRAVGGSLNMSQPGASVDAVQPVPHGPGTRLAATLRTYNAPGRSYSLAALTMRDREQYGAEHYICAHDFTLGDNSGHPHLHALLLTTRLLVPGVRWSRRPYVPQWSRAVDRDGLGLPAREFGCD